MGGLSRKYTAIRKIKENENIDHLLLDSGNFLFSSPRKVDKNGNSVHTAMGIARIYREMNYDAVNVGINDLSAGINFLKGLDFLPWVCANFYDNSDKTIFRPYILKTDSELKYAIIGLSPPPLSTSSEYSYRSWHKILAPLLQELRPKVDCIILLSSLNDNENKEIAQKFPDIRLIISALSTSGNISPRITNKTLITQTADRGRYLGQLYLLNPGLYDWINTSTPNVANLEKQRKTLDYRLSRIDYLMTKNDNNQDTLAVLEKQKIQILKQLKALEYKNPGELVTSKSTFKAAFTPLTQNIEEDRRINKMIKEIKKESGSYKN